MVDRRKTVRRLFVAGFAALALVVGVVAIPTFGIGRQGNLPGIYDSSKKVAAESAPDVDPESLPHDHDNPATKNDISRGGEVGKNVADPTNSAERAIATAYVAQARRAPDPPLTSVRPVQKRQPVPAGPLRDGQRLLPDGRQADVLQGDRPRRLPALHQAAGSSAPPTAWPTRPSAATVWAGGPPPAARRGRRFTFTRGGTLAGDQGQSRAFRLLRTQGLRGVPGGRHQHQGRPARRRHAVPGGARLRRRRTPTA